MVIVHSKVFTEDNIRRSSRLLYEGNNTPKGTDFVYYQHTERHNADWLRLHQ